MQPCNVLDDRITDIRQRQHGSGSPQFGGGLGHAIDHAARLVLGNRVKTGLAQRQQSGRAIATHAGQQYATAANGRVLRQTFEQDINRGAADQLRPLLGPTQAAGLIDDDIARADPPRHDLARLATPFTRVNAATGNGVD